LKAAVNDEAAKTVRSVDPAEPLDDALLDDEDEHAPKTIAAKTTGTTSNRFIHPPPP
jgi:hypothetical protein